MKMNVKIIILVAVAVGLVAIAIRMDILPFHRSKKAAAHHTDESIIDLHDKKELDEVVAGSSTKPAVIKVSASWCPPCQQLKPVFHAVADEMHNQITFAQIDIDEFQDKPEISSVTSLPTVLFFKGGKEVHRSTGFRSADQLKEELKKLE